MNHPHSENRVDSPGSGPLLGVVERKIATSFGDLNVHVGGKPDGPAIVCWPSLMLGATMWQHQYRHFAPTHRVVTIDPPGIGRSEPLRRPISLENSARVLVEILDAIAIDRCLLIGNSWGAMLATTFPAWHPERLIGAVAINTTASLPTMPETIQMSLLANALYLHERVPEWWVTLARQAFAGDTAEATRPEFLDYFRCILDEDPKSISFQLRGILLGRTDRHELLRTIHNAPVLVIAGEEDRQFPVHIVRKAANAIAGSRFVVLQETGHLTSLERPDLVNAEIDRFLATLAHGLVQNQATCCSRGSSRSQP